MHAAPGGIFSDTAEASSIPIIPSEIPRLSHFSTGLYQHAQNFGGIGLHRGVAVLPQSCGSWTTAYTRVCCRDGGGRSSVPGCSRTSPTEAVLELLPASLREGTLLRANPSKDGDAELRG
jgi:hypothetical protein